MKLRTTDMERISHRKCEKKGCKNKSFAIFHTKYLCESHFREEKPSKEIWGRGRKIRLSTEYWKEPYYMI